MTDTKIAKIEHTCMQCKGPITEGETYEFIMDGHALPVHTVCPVIIEPDDPLPEFTPPFYKIVKWVLDSFDVKV